MIGGKLDPQEANCTIVIYRSFEDACVANDLPTAVAAGDRKWRCGRIVSRCLFSKQRLNQPMRS